MCLTSRPFVDEFQKQAPSTLVRIDASALLLEGKALSSLSPFSIDILPHRENAAYLNLMNAVLLYAALSADVAHA